MRRFALYLALLLVAVWIGVKIAADPGYLLLSYQHWTVEMPLWSAVIAILILFTLFYFVLRFWYRIRTTPTRWRTKKQQRQQQKLLQLTHQGFLALANGQWASARNKLLKATTYTKTPWLYYSGAALAAHKLKAYEYRDAYLLKAAEDAPDAEVATDLLRAQLQFAQQHPEQAVVPLEHAYKLAPKQQDVLQLLAETYEKLQRWPDLLALMPALHKNHVFPEARLLELETAARRDELVKSAQQTDAKALALAWRNLPRAWQQNPALLHEYTYLLQSKGEKDQALEILRKALSKIWDDRLVSLYGYIQGNKPDQQLTDAETWLPNHEKDAVLLLVLARLSLRNQLWGKARSYLEASIAIKPTAEAYRELGQLLDRMGENKTAVISCFVKGLDLN